MEVTSFSLIDPVTGVAISGYNPLTDGETINLATLPSRNIAIRADVDDCDTASVRFLLDGDFISVDNFKPFSFWEDQAPCTFGSFPIEPGTYEFTATPYSGANASGTAGTPLTIGLTFILDIDEEIPPPEPPAPDVDGYTAFTESGDTVKIHVSITGDDTTGDGSSGNPYQTLAKARTLLRDDMPDWVLLKKGDTFPNDSDYTINIHKSGKSAAEPKMIGAYGAGTARPILKARGAVTTFANSGTPVDFVAIVGIDFWPEELDPDDPAYDIEGVNSSELVRLARPGDDYLIEDCRFRHGRPSVIDPVSNLRFRRSVFTDQTRTSGIYVENNGLPWAIYECFFIHCGFHDPDYPRYIQSGHGVYQNSHSGPVYIKGCLFAQCGHFGIQQRGGGILENCFIVQCPLAHRNGMTPSTVIDCVIMDPTALGTTGGRGCGSEATRTPDVWYDGCIIASKVPGVGSGHAIRLEYKDTSPFVAGNPPEIPPPNPQTKITNCTIFNWLGPCVRIRMRDGKLTMTDNILVNETGDDDDGDPIELVDMERTTLTMAFSGNQYFSGGPAASWFQVNGSNMTYAQWVAYTGETGSTNTAVTFVDDTVSIEKYNEDELGGSPDDLEEFLAAARTMSRDTGWDADYLAATINDYIRAGFTPA